MSLLCHMDTKAAKVLEHASYSLDITAIIAYMDRPSSMQVACSTFDCCTSAMTKGSAQRAAAGITCNIQSMIYMRFIAVMTSCVL